MTRILCIFLLFCSFQSIGQKGYNLSFEGQTFPRQERYEKKNYKTKSSLTETLEKLKRKHISKGHVLATVDSVVWENQTARVFYYFGPQFKQLHIDVNKEQAYLIKKIPRLNEKFLRKTPFKPHEIADLLESITLYLQKNGYPFSRVWLEVENLDPLNASAHLHIDEGNEIRISEIHLKGESKVSEKYLTNFIAIREGDLYDESRMAKIGSRINQIQFIDEIKPHEILFTPEGAELFLYLKSNPVSLINGVVGLQPNPVTGENVFTGDVRLKLQNVINRGELIDINWRSLQPQTQDLKLYTSYPFLFNSPFGAEFRFDLYRRDSTFLTTLIDIGAQYFMRGGNYLKVFYEAENSNLLSGAANSVGLPNTNFSSVNTNRYGVGLFRRQLDYLPNPSRGLFIETDISAGRRTSRRIDSDSSDINTTFLLRFNMEWFVPLSRRHILRIGNRTRAYYAPSIFVNELFRFGGLTTQRGFDEEELFASTLSTFSLEYRFLVDRDSHAFLFYDQSFYENASGNYYQDNPFGVGAGFSFGTNIGVFSISYAMGQQFDNPMLLRNGKVHFGYVSYF